MSRIRDHRLPVVVPLIAAALAHVRSLWGGFTNWDDPSYLLHNPLTQAPLSHGLGALLLTPEISYAIPVTTLFYAGQRELFALNPTAFHAVSLLLHIGNVALCLVLARRLGLRSAVACWGALVFAVHPICVEPIAWVVGQKDLLATALLLTALVVRAGARGDTTMRSILCVWLCVLAIGAKPSAVSAPILLMALDWTKGRPLKSRSNVLTYVLLGAVAFAAILAATGGHSARSATAPHFGLNSVLNALWAVTLQVRHLIAPSQLAARYFPPTGVEYYAMIAMGVILVACYAAAIANAIRSNRRVLALSLVAMLAAYAPVSGLVQITRGPADSYLYAPLALATLAIAACLQHWPPTKRVRVLFVAACALLAVASWRQIPVWRSSTALWANLADINPDEPRALTRLGNAFVYEENIEAALAVFANVENRFPDYAPAHADRGQLLAALGRAKEAEIDIARAAQLADNADYREHYAFFLITRSDIEPTDARLAEQAIAELAPTLAERGRRLPSLRRASELLRRYGQDQLAVAVEARIDSLGEATDDDDGAADGTR